LERLSIAEEKNVLFNQPDAVDFSEEISIASIKISDGAVDHGVKAGLGCFKVIRAVDSRKVKSQNQVFVGCNYFAILVVVHIKALQEKIKVKENGVERIGGGL
jgi:hypothetical protein